MYFSTGLLGGEPGGVDGVFGFFRFAASTTSWNKKKMKQSKKKTGPKTIREFEPAYHYDVVGKLHWKCGGHLHTGIQFVSMVTKFRCWRASVC